MNHLIGNLEYFRARAAGKTPVSRIGAADQL